MNSNKIFLPELEDINQEQLKAGIRKNILNNNSFNNFLNMNNNTSNQGKENIVYEKADQIIRNSSPGTNNNKILDKQKQLETKKSIIISNFSQENNKTLLVNKNSILENKKVSERKFFMRNSMNPSFYDAVQNKNFPDDLFGNFESRENNSLPIKSNNEDKMHLYIESFRNMLREASSNILIKNELPEKARKIEELSKLYQSLAKEKDSITKAFEDREKFYLEKINLLEKQLNEPITEDIHSIQTQIKEYDIQIEILNKNLADINQSNLMEKDNCYKITTEIINHKKKLAEELSDLEKYKKIFFLNHAIVNSNRPDVILKCNFEETSANENSFIYDKAINHNANYSIHNFGNNKSSIGNNSINNQKSAGIGVINTLKNNSNGLGLTVINNFNLQNELHKNINNDKAKSEKINEFSYTNSKINNYTYENTGFFDKPDKNVRNNNYQSNPKLVIEGYKNSSKPNQK